MRKTLFLILSLIAFAACSHKPTPQQLAEDYIYSLAYHPEHLKVLSCSAVLRPDTTIFSTSYHIVAVDGEPISYREWINVTAVYTDSVKVTHVFLPEHYYCCATIECMNDCGETVHETVEVAILPNDSVIMFDTYRNRYYKSFCDTVYAQQDTLTDVREYIGYLDEWNGWICKQMLMQFHAHSDIE